VVFQDKSLQCSQCGATFTFTAGEQEFYQSKGYANEPKRCPTCRQARRADRGGSGVAAVDGAVRPARQMFPAVCSECGKETQVPFEPRSGRPVYCRDCYNKTRLNK
jgi:CxxC-x17-CxxC domain-containing protein